MHQKDVETEHARERLSAAEAMASECEANAAVLRANVQSSKESMQRMLDDIADQENRVSEIRGRIDEGQKRIDEINSALRELEQKTAQNNNVLDGCRMKLQSREQVVNQLSERSTKLNIDARSMDSRINMLSEMEKDYDGYSRAVKTIMRETQRGNLQILSARTMSAPSQ